MTTLGIDIGCISLKAALVGQAEDQDLFSDLLQRHPDLFQTPRDGLTLVEGRPVLVALYRRIKGSPAEAAEALLGELLAVLPEGSVHGARVTGSGGRLVGPALDATFENEFKAITRGIGALNPETQTIFEMGGETSKFIRLEAGDGGCAGIVDYQTNGDCAAGTGSFMDQQASRLLYDIEDVGGIVLEAAKRRQHRRPLQRVRQERHDPRPAEGLRAARGAARPLRRRHAQLQGHHRQGQGHRPARGVHRRRGRQRRRRALAARGVRASTTASSSSPSTTRAWAPSARPSSRPTSRPRATAPILGLDVDSLPAAEFPTTEPLSMERVVLLRDMARPYEFEGDEVVDVYMGIDIGSVSTNLVVVNDAGEVIKEIYTKTDARPVEVVTKGLADIRDEIGHRINLLGVGTTGSGRELIGELTGADIITDEITAHKTGADFIGRKIGKQCDTIFEIGGQDSKFISLQDGIVVDFAMNEACAAGTGSFLEEQAEKLGINIIGEFAELALGSDTPVRLGERCTVFMERDVMAYQQRGARRDDLVAGLAFSIATNYLNRLVRERHIGDVIFFQGGTAYNDAVAAAFSQILEQGSHRAAAQRRHGRARHGAARARARAAHGRAHLVPRLGPAAGRLHGARLRLQGAAPTSATCASSPSRARRRTGATSAPTATASRPRSTRSPSSPTSSPTARSSCWRRTRRHAHACRSRRPPSASRAPCTPTTACRSGRPSSPSWACARCSRRRATRPSARRAWRSPSPSRASPSGSRTATCSGCSTRASTGSSCPTRSTKRPSSCSTTRTPARGARRCRSWSSTRRGSRRTASKILDPRVRFRDGREGLIRDFAEMMQTLGVNKTQVRGALDAAYKAQDVFRGKLLAAGAEALERLDLAGELGVVLVGRPYNMYDKGINMDIPRKLRKFYGVNVIPLDFLPIRGIDIDPVVPNMFWNYGRKILQTATFVRDRENLHLIYMTNFKCGPDSYIKHYVREASGKPYPDPAVRRAPERRRRHDALRGVPGQQGLPSLVVAGRGRRGS